MATIASSRSNSSLSLTLNKATISNQQLSRSLERALDEATYTGELILTSRKLRDFPNVKCDLSDTIIADLSRNGFVEFPRVLCSFFSLERLNLYNNAIKALPDQIVQIHMLKVLNLSRNQLTFLPSSLCKLPNLEILILNNNKLLALPEEIGQLEKLIELDVSCNEITQLPYQIGSLPSLRTLNISRNAIVELPTELCNLKLIQLDCSFNRLTRLPLNLREMGSLIELNVENNSLECPPASICTLGLLHIMRFLLVEAMKEEKRRGVLTENEINAKYRNSFSYQGSRHLQCGMKTLVPSDSGYLTTESSEKTLGDDDSVLSMSNDPTVRSEPTLMLTLADEFSKELLRQKSEYEKKKDQAYHLKAHLLQQLGETEDQRAKARGEARKIHDEKLAKIEKQREDARRKMENSKNFHLFTFSNDDLSRERSSPAGGKDMRMNSGHRRACLQQQRSLPDDLMANDLPIRQMKQTIEERLKVTLPDDLAAALSDGVVLCHFVNQIQPRAVQSIHVPSQAVPKLSLAKCRRNLENFLDASRRLGVPEIIMSFTADLKLPDYEQLECPVVNVSSAALRAGSFHLAKYCDLQFKEFMLCRQEEQDPRKCIKEGKDVSLCSINFFRKVRDSCNDTFTTFWTCLDNTAEGEMTFHNCRAEQRAFEQCAKTNMNLERPEPGYFSMVRMHDTKRPPPSDPFRIGSSERHPPKMEVPDPPSISQADEYPEAKLGMKFGQRKPWMFEAKLWD